MQSSKPRVVKSYDSLEPELQEQIKLAYPNGFAQHLVSYTNAAGEKVSALIFETDDRHYLVKMTRAQALQIIAADKDYNADGTLKAGVKEEYEDKYGDLDYMSDYMGGDDDEEESDGDDDDDGDDDRGSRGGGGYDDDY